MVKTVDMVPIASLDVNLDDVVAIGGPGVGEAEVVMPLLAELRAAGGEDYGALVVVYRRGADMGDAGAFREKVMAHLSGRKVEGIGENVSRETKTINLAADRFVTRDEVRKLVEGDDLGVVGVDGFVCDFIQIRNDELKVHIRVGVENGSELIDEVMGKLGDRLKAYLRSEKHD